MLVLFMPLNKVRAAAGGVSDNDLHGMHTTDCQSCTEQQSETGTYFALSVALAHSWYGMMMLHQCSIRDQNTAPQLQQGPWEGRFSYQ